MPVSGHPFASNREITRLTRDTESPVTTAIAVCVLPTFKIRAQYRLVPVGFGKVIGQRSCCRALWGTRNLRARLLHYVRLTLHKLVVAQIDLALQRTIPELDAFALRHEFGITHRTVAQRCLRDKLPVQCPTVDLGRQVRFTGVCVRVR